MTKRDLLGFKLPSDCKNFLLVGPYTWGVGPTMEEALKNVRVPARNIIGVLAGDDCYVDELGNAYAKHTLWKAIDGGK